MCCIHETTSIFYLLVLSLSCLQYYSLLLFCEYNNTITSNILHIHIPYFKYPYLWSITKWNVNRDSHVKSKFSFKIKFYSHADNNNNEQSWNGKMVYEFEKTVREPTTTSRFLSLFQCFFGFGITVCLYINEKYENHMKFYELIHLLEHLFISPIYFSVSFNIFSISINAFNMCLSLYKYRSHIWYDRSMNKWMRR